MHTIHYYAKKIKISSSKLYVFETMYLKIHFILKLMKHFDVENEENFSKKIVFLYIHYFNMCCRVQKFHAK